MNDRARTKPTGRPKGGKNAPNPTAALPTTPLTPKATGSPSANAAAKRMLKRLIQGEQPPTQPMSIVDRLAGSPYSNPIIQVNRVDHDDRKTLDFALNLSESMFRYGAGALEVETSLIAVTAAFGLKNVDVDITNQSVMINYAPKDQIPMTVMRVVRSWTANYAGLASIHQLVTKIVDGDVDRATASVELREITTSSKPFAKWMVTASIAVFAAAIAGIIGGDWLASLFAAAGTVMVDVIQRVLGKWRVPEFFSVAACAFCVTALAELVWWSPIPVPPGLVVAGGILLLLPAGRLVTATQDAINGFPVTAAGRFLSAFLVFGALISGISVALVVGAMLGIPELDVARTYENGYPVPVVVALVAVAGMAICVVEQSALKLVLPTALVGVAGYLVVLLAVQLDFGFRLTPAISAVVIGFVARFVALRMGAPQLVVAIPATLFLYPGLSIFRAMYGISIDAANIQPGVVSLFNALAVILAIAAGLVLGDNLARPLTKGLNSNERRRSRRR